jgi:hypothetical protein
MVFLVQMGGQLPLCCCRTLRARQQSPRIAIRCLLGAKRLKTSECSRQRMLASKLAHPLAADPRRLSFGKI